MKPESHAWLALNDRAALLLRAGFADRVLRAAREAVPTFASQFALSAATAAVCLAVVCFVHSRMVANETARNLAAWQEYAAEAQQFGQLP
ncbi:MAG TPA: hypothetical protein VHE13_07400 [Opitutus sp.]|nr:hypothetical protein [Opitutus sp.]